MASEAREIVLLRSASSALVEASSLDEIKDIRDRAEAIRQYAKAQGLGFDVQNYGAEVKIRAERKAGALLAGMEKHRAGRPSDNRSHDVTNCAPKLCDLGIEKMQSHRWQQEASVPDHQFEQHIAEAWAERKEITSSGVLGLAKVNNNKKRNNSVATGAESSKTLEALIDAGEKFACVYADPPWRYGNQATRASTDNHYPTMSPDEIAALPIASLAADDAHLHLWTTNAFLFDCQRIMEAWGFTYKSVFVWVKPQMGIGNYWRVSHEFMLFGVRGDCPFLDHGQKSWLEAKRTSHSTKPQAVRRIIEKVSPSPRLELFGRQLADGWTVWGNQIRRTMFDKEVVA